MYPHQDATMPPTFAMIIFSISHHNWLTRGIRHLFRERQQRPLQAPERHMHTVLDQRDHGLSGGGIGGNVMGCMYRHHACRGCMDPTMHMHTQS
jgi:hypothetical protein